MCVLMNNIFKERTLQLFRPGIGTSRKCLQILTICRKCNLLDILMIMRKVPEVLDYLANIWQMLTLVMFYYNARSATVQRRHNIKYLAVLLNMGPSGR